MQRAKCLKDIENNPEVFCYSPILTKDFCNLFASTVTVKINKLFKTKNLLNSEKKNKSRPALVCETSCFSISKAFDTNLEDIINLSCLESPDSHCSLSFQKLFMKSAQSTMNSTKIKSFSLSDDSGFETTEKYSEEYLSNLIQKYQNPEVFEIVLQLSVFLSPSPLFFTYLIILPDSSIYEGQLNDKNQPNGFGSRYYRDGTVYKGF